jgi:hypothetical protein
MGVFRGGVPARAQLPGGEGLAGEEGEAARKKKTLGILAARLGRAVYHMLRKREAFDVRRFLGQ